MDEIYLVIRNEQTGKRICIVKSYTDCMLYNSKYKKGNYAIMFRDAYLSGKLYK